MINFKWSWVWDSPPVEALILSMSKTLYLLLSTGSTQGDRNMSRHGWNIVDWDLKHQHKQTRICLGEHKLYLSERTDYSKTCLKRPLKKGPKIDFQDQLSLNTGHKYCRMFQESILQYFRPSLSYHLSLRPLFCLLLRGHLRQVLITYKLLCINI